MATRQTRQQKFPNTDTFTYYNANPKNKIAGDCVARAICTALDMPWEQVIRELTELGIKMGTVFNETKTYEKYLASKGWKKQKQPRKADNTKYTGEEFCQRVARNRTIVAHIGGHHIVCIKGNKVYDIWDSTYKCIGNYWVKE